MNQARVHKRTFSPLCRWRVGNDSLDSIGTTLGLWSSMSSQGSENTPPVSLSLIKTTGDLWTESVLAVSQPVPWGAEVWSPPSSPHPYWRLSPFLRCPVLVTGSLTLLHPVAFVCVCACVCIYVHVRARTLVAFIMSLRSTHFFKRKYC